MLTIMPQYIRKEPNGGTTRGLSQRFQPRGQGVAFQLQGEVVWSWKASQQMARPYGGVGVSLHRAITIQDDDGNTFMVNGHCLKTFLVHDKALNEDIDVIDIVDHGYMLD